MENTENIGELPVVEEELVKKSNKATKERMKELNEIKRICSRYLCDIRSGIRFYVYHDV